MQDVFGEALQKLSSVKPQVTARRMDVTSVSYAFSSGIELPDKTGDVAEFPSSETPTAPLSIFHPLPCEPESSTTIECSAETAVSTTGNVVAISETTTLQSEAMLAPVDPQPVSSEPEMLPALFSLPVGLETPATVAAASEPQSRSVLEFLRSHRRRTAALVILFCMGVIWYDDGSIESDALKSEAADADAIGQESLLSEFDAFDAKPMREPADPVETPADNDLMFSIPPVPGAVQAPAESMVDADPSHAAPSRFEGGSDLTTSPRPSGFGFGSRVESEASAPDSANARSVKFTGRIAPLK